MIISPTSGQIKVKTIPGPPWRSWGCCMWSSIRFIGTIYRKINLNLARKPTLIVDCGILRVSPCFRLFKRKGQRNTLSINRFSLWNKVFLTTPIYSLKTRKTVVRYSLSAISRFSCCTKMQRPRANKLLSVFNPVSYQVVFRVVRCILTHFGSLARLNISNLEIFCDF